MDVVFGVMEMVIGVGGRMWVWATSALCRTAARLDARDTEDGKWYFDELLWLFEMRESECGSGDVDVCVRVVMCV